MLLDLLLPTPTSREPATTDPEEHTLTLARAIEDLPSDERVILCLIHFEGLSPQQISSVLGIPDAAAVDLHWRALDRLRSSLL